MPCISHPSGTPLQDKKRAKDLERRGGNTSSGGAVSFLDLNRHRGGAGDGVRLLFFVVFFNVFFLFPRFSFCLLPSSVHLSISAFVAVFSAVFTCVAVFTAACICVLCLCSCVRLQSPIPALLFSLSL